MSLAQHKRQLIVLLTIMFFISQACTDIFVPALPVMTQQFHSTLSHMTLTITIYTYAQAFFFLFIGVISDLFGRRKVFLITVLLQITSSFLIAKSTSLYTILLLRVLQASGSGAIYIVSRLIIKDVMDQHDQINAVGIFVAALPLSLALAPVIGAWLTAHWGWSACFTAVGFFQGILLCWAFFLLEESNPYQDKFRQNFTWYGHFAGYYRVITDKYFLNLFLIVGGIFGSYYSFISISSYMYIDEYNISSILYSYTFIGVAIGYLIANRIMIWLNNNQFKPLGLIRLGLRISLIGITIMLIGIIFFKINWLTLTMVTLGAIMGRAATAFINPPIQVIVTHQFGELGAYALGLLSCLQYISAALGSIVAATIPLKPSLSLVISSILFTLLSGIGYYYCPKSRLQ